MKPDMKPDVSWHIQGLARLHVKHRFADILFQFGVIRKSGVVQRDASVT
jgi:hypothetical protein